VIVLVFKTCDRRLSAAMVGSTPTRFRQVTSLVRRKEKTVSEIGQDDVHPDQNLKPL
jgi:hypothetical protein